MKLICKSKCKQLWERTISLLNLCSKTSPKVKMILCYMRFKEKQNNYIININHLNKISIDWCNETKWTHLTAINYFAFVGSLTFISTENGIGKPRLNLAACVHLMLMPLGKV